MDSNADNAEQNTPVPLNQSHAIAKRSYHESGAEHGQATVETHEVNENLQSTISNLKQEPIQQNTTSVDKIQPIRCESEAKETEMSLRSNVIIASSTLTNTTKPKSESNQFTALLKDTKSYDDSLPLSLQTDDPSNTILKSSDYDMCDMVMDYLFWIRIFVLILSIFLCILATSYCLGQVIDVKLDIITECDGDKTLEEIWKHSYDAYVDNGGIMNEESQYGWSNESCWTTHKVEINTKQIWDHNQYTAQWTDKLNAQCVFFGLVSAFLVGTIFYNIYTLIKDILAINKGRKSLGSGSCFDCKISRMDKVVDFVKKIYEKWFGRDQIGRIFRKFIGEWIEFIVQSQALLLYNGYYTNDPNNQTDVYLANKPEFIIIFAIIIFVNCFGSGLLWSFYALLPQRVYGLSFDRCLFFVDKFSDLLYTVFPFYMRLADDYNKNSDNILVLLQQLRIDAFVAFLATFVPLLFLSIKCLSLIRSTRKRMLEKVFPHQSETKDVSDENRDDEMNWINKDCQCECKYNMRALKQMVIALMSVLFIGFGIGVLAYTLSHIQSSKKYCASVSETKYTSGGTLSGSDIGILSDNPELYLWDNCLYKVYPFVNNNKYKCQCRVFVVDWQNLETTENEREQNLNLTQDTILKGVLNHWYMMEKFYSFGTIPESQILFKFESSMYKSVHMKAFDWRDTFISSMEDGISGWKELEYLAFLHTSVSKALPSDFGGLESIQYILFEDNAFTEIPSSICNLKNLKVLEIELEVNIQSLPHCISELSELQALWIEITALSQIPLSIFNMPNLLELSLFNSYINYDNLLNYNNLSNITDDLQYFEFNNNTRYWLTTNPICDEIDLLPSNLQLLINETCPHQCTSNNTRDYFPTFCSPRLLGDGQCSSGCHLDPCDWDKGDCVQLCFAEDLANCTFDKLTNDRCDDGCNNEFCSSYGVVSGFTVPVVREIWNNETQTMEYFAADKYNCPFDGFPVNFSMKACSESRSIYLDLDVVEDDIFRQCQPGAIDDGDCDDSCRTWECLYDGRDCEEGMGCRVGSICGNTYMAWNQFTSVGVYKYDHVYTCSEIWPLAVRLMGNDPGNCTEIVSEEDYNNDGYMNFREFVGIAAYFTNDEVNYFRQINCSQCIGMEYYNV